MNGCPVQWLEAKNFYGSGCQMLSKSLCKQVGKYCEHYVSFNASNEKVQS